MAIIDEPKNLTKAIELNDANKWDLAMQEDYKFFIIKVM